MQHVFMKSPFPGWEIYEYRYKCVHLYCGGLLPQSTQSAGPVRFFIFCSLRLSRLAILVAGKRPQCNVVRISWECTPPYLSTGKSDLLQPVQAEVVLGQLSTYLASWIVTQAWVGACTNRGTGVYICTTEDRSLKRGWGGHTREKKNLERKF
jgi:hypothetical protein